jgi:probable F420-dependent oxidoreductase
MTPQLGFALPQFGEFARDDLIRFASTAEQLGAASLWVGDRLLAAVHPTIGYAGTDTMPAEMRANFDPFTALAAAAAVTATVRLGSSVLVAPLYPPVQLARQLTSIDVLSGGRLTVGLGIGWSPDEYRAVGVPFTRRGAQFDELLDVLDKLWTSNPVEHHGTRWSVPPSWVDLKPVQQPRPPVYLGSTTAHGLSRVGRRADGWLPRVRLPDQVDLDTLRRGREIIDRAAIDAGRDPASIGTVVRINPAAESRVTKVADTVKLLADNGYTDAFVDLIYLATNTDARLEWVQRLLAASS